MCCVVFDIREIQTLFGGHKYTVIAISLVHHESCLHRAVVCNLVFLFNIAQRQDICYALWIVPYRTIALQIALLSIIASPVLQYKVRVRFGSLILVSNFLFENTSTVDWLSNRIQLARLPALSCNEHVTSFCRKAKPL
jgi:hypothetical protein